MTHTCPRLKDHWEKGAEWLQEVREDFYEIVAGGCDRVLYSWTHSNCDCQNKTNSVNTVLWSSKGLMILNYKEILCENILSLSWESTKRFFTFMDSQSTVEKKASRTENRWITICPYVLLNAFLYSILVDAWKTWGMYLVWGVRVKLNG